MESEILQLINKRREGTYWDFKEKHHENKASLLHDILCLSNAVSKKDKYLIFGVSDPSSGCAIVGVPEENRRSQSDIIDFIRSKKFAIDNRPEVELRTLILNEKEVDVLIVYDDRRKPYYLRENYRDKDKIVRANFIYTRNLDTNTPIDQSTDNWLIESMWRERFGLDLQPAQRMVELLRKPQEWDKDVGNKKFAYHKYSPEYQIEFGEVSEFKDVYSYFYINEKSFIGTASFRYLNTELFSLPYVYCDEMRVQLVDPTNGSIRVQGRELWYQYFILNSRVGAFLEFITDGTLDLNSRMSESAFVIYRDEKERDDFENYLSRNLDQLDAFQDSELGLMKQQRIVESGESFVFNPVEMIKICELFEEWSLRKA